MNGFEWPWLSRTRPMLQSEAAECGLTCVAMIAAHYGHRVNVGGLRRQFPTSMKGATLTQLISVASQLELAPRADLEFGPGKLTALYRELSERYLRQPPAAGFTGEIVLQEK